ncbi:MAG: hypothetical protein NZ580_04170 [Bacteroidia bacterium]|nr:hypothetical protein [Bacteroidia bacterium]
MLRRLLYHSAVYGLTVALGRLLNWLLTPLYVHRLRVEDFGRLSELYSWIVFGLIAAGMGMETAYLRFGGGFWRMLRLMAIGGAVLAVVLSIAAYFLAPRLGYAGAEYLLWLTIAIWSVDAWGSFALAHQRAIGAPMRFAIIQLSHITILLLLNLWGVGIQGYGLGFILGANLLASLWKLGWALRYAPPPTQPTPPEVPSDLGLLRYGITLSFMGILGAMNEVLDRVLLARYDLTQTAIYGAAYRVAMALALFVQAYRQAGEPFLLKEQRGNRSFYEKSWILYHTIALSGVFLLSLWAKPIVSTTWGGLLPKPLFPAHYHQGLTIVPVLLWANLFAGSLIQASVWYKLRSLPYQGVIITAVGACITWLGNLYGIPRYGYIACAWTTLLSYGVMVGISLAWGRYYGESAFRMLPLLPSMMVAALPTFVKEINPLLFSIVGLGAIGGWSYFLLRKLRFSVS